MGNRFMSPLKLRYVPVKKNERDKTPVSCMSFADLCEAPVRGKERNNKQRYDIYVDNINVTPQLHV